MKLIAPVVRSTALFLLGGAVAFAQSSNAPAMRPAAAAPTPANATTGHDAKIAYSHGQLEVDADNSSLNQILHEIARVTGMKITGSVADASVFGKYGPAAPAEVLKSLLDGTGVNMLLKETASGTPAELILTPRNGPPSPPTPAGEQTVAAAVEVSPTTVPAGPDGGPAPVNGVTILDINGNPAPPGSLVPPAAAPPPETPQQMQQRLQQAQQLQQATQQRQQAGH
jgi:hypothetical protein